MKSLFNLTDMHIHPSSPNSSISEENAATKIQAGFRGYRVRKQLKKVVHPDCGGSSGGGGSSNGNNRENYSKSAGRRMSTMDTKEEEKSATKIQASVRGFLVRKKQKLAADAAIKIQAGFRGFKARRDLKKMKVKT